MDNLEELAATLVKIVEMRKQAASDIVEVADFRKNRENARGEPMKKTLCRNLFSALVLLLSAGPSFASSQLVTVSTTAIGISTTPCPAAIVEVITNSIYYSLHDPTVTPDSTYHALSAGSVVNLTEPFRFRAVRQAGVDATIRVSCVAGGQVTSIAKSAAGSGGDGKILDGTAAGEADVIGSAPVGTEQGIVTRNIPSGTQTISGAVTNAGTFATQATLQAGTAEIGKLAAGIAEIGNVKNSGTFVVQNTNAAETTKVLGTVRAQGNLGAAFDAATGAAPPANAILAGGLVGGATGGFMGGVPICDTQAVVNISTITTTLIVTGVSGRHVRVCGFSLVTALANNVAFLSGTGATCGVGTAGMSGGTTAASGYNLAANGGIAHGGGVGTVLKTVATGDSVCIITSATTQLSGQLSYVIY